MVVNRFIHFISRWCYAPGVALYLWVANKMTDSHKKVSVILAFYNDIELLRLSLQSLAASHSSDFEVLIADDGSCEKVVQEVQGLLNAYPFPITHIWQVDDGFGKTVALNKAVVAAAGQWLIFLDADCVPQSNFVADHLRRCESGICLVGRRVNVFRDAIGVLDCSAPHKIFNKNFLKLLWWSMRGKVTHLERGVRAPAFLKLMFPKKSWGIVGCNFSIAKADLLAINGFDERHRIAWGAEDSDLQRRLELKGVRLQSLVQQACQVHFDASFFSRRVGGVAKPDYLGMAARENHYWTAHGIVKGEKTQG